jgi:hypothetical protein
MRNSYIGSVTTPPVLAKPTNHQRARSGELYSNSERALESDANLPQPTRDRVRTRAGLVHHSFVSILDRPQVAESGRGYAGSNKPLERLPLFRLGRCENVMEGERKLMVGAAVDRAAGLVLTCAAPLLEEESMAGPG